MSKLKRVFTILMCILLTLPMCLVSKPNNVYAAVGEKPTNNTIPTACSVNYRAGHDGNSTSDSENTVSYDLRNYDQASFTWTCGLYDDCGNYDWAKSEVRLIMKDNNNKNLLSFSKTYTNPSRGSWSKTVDWDLQSLRNNGEDLSNVSFQAYVLAGTTYYNRATASITDVSLISYTPSFQPNSYVQSNGNLTPVNLGLADAFNEDVVAKASYAISATNTTSLDMILDGTTTSQDGDSATFDIDIKNLPRHKDGNHLDADSNGVCDRCSNPNDICTCHSLQFKAHGSNGHAETSVGYFHCDYTPTYSQKLEDGDKRVTTIEGSSTPLAIYATFLNQGTSSCTGWYKWQYKTSAEDTWKDINNETSVLADNIVVGATEDNPAGTSYAKSSVFSISSISGKKKVSRLSVKAQSTDMDGYVFRCLLMSGESTIKNGSETNANTNSFTLSVLPSQYKYFQNIQRLDSIGKEVYDNSLLFLTFANESGGDGRSEYVHGNLRETFINPVNSKPYFNIINLDKCDEATAKKLYGIGNGAFTEEADKMLTATYEGSDGTPETVELGNYADMVADKSNITRDERDALIRQVIADMNTSDTPINNLRSITENADDTNKVTIKAGKNIVISYLSPFRTCDGKEHTFADTNTDGKCDECGYADYDNIVNYVFTATEVIGKDNEPPVIHEIIANWKANAEGEPKGFYPGGAVFKQGIEADNNQPLSNSVARPFQNLVLTADITDNCVATEDLDIKWYHKKLGVNQIFEEIKGANTTTYEINGHDNSNGTYKVTANDRINGTTVEKEFEVGVAWDSVEPLVTARIIPDGEGYTTYKEVVVEASDVSSGLDNRPYLISTVKLTDDELAEDDRWSQKSSRNIVENNCRLYVYVRDAAGCIAKLGEDDDEQLVATNIDHTAPCVEGITAEKVGEDENATVEVTINAHDDCTDSASLNYKVAWICERTSSNYGEHSIGDEVVVKDYSNDNKFIAKENGYYMLYVSDEAGNITPVYSSYIDVKFITGQLDDIFKDDVGGGFVDETGGFTDKQGGFEDKKGGFEDHRGGFTDGFVDNKGGFIDTEGGYVDNNGFINNNGFVDNKFVDKNGFIDENGYVDKNNFHDYKGDTSQADGKCDNCGAENADCTCGNNVDNESPDGKCDGCTAENADSCTCEKDNKCDKCGNDKTTCTDTNPDTLCDNCYQTKDKCTCGPDGKCDGCGKEEDSCTCEKDNKCDVCGGNITDCICPKDDKCDKCGNVYDSCTCEKDSLCDKCGKSEAECMCGDGICDRCQETEENCTCKDGLCDVCHNTKENCICKDGVCDGCHKDEAHCDCPDGLCDKCGKDEEHCDCPDGICDKCGKDEAHCDCPDGLCDKCGKDEEHCNCPDGLCDKCGQDKEHCHCVGVSVTWQRSPLSYTNGDVTFTIRATMDALDPLPFSWDDGATWTDETKHVVTENGTYKISVKDKHGNIYSKEEEVKNIDKEIPYLTGSLNSDTNTITLSASDNADGSGLYKITYFFTPEGSTTESEELAFRPFDANQYNAADLNFYVEEAGKYRFRLYDQTEASTPGSGNYYDFTVSSNPEDLATTNPDVSTDPNVMKGYITASPTDWTTGNVVLTLNMSDEGLANRPYCWNGTDWVTTPYITIEENCTVNLQVKDKQGHIFKAAPFEVTNIDKVAPEFTINYSATNGNYVEINATDEGSGIASIYWQGGTVTSLTKALEVQGAPKSGSFNIQVPANGTYRVWVVDVAGNGYLMEASNTFKATSVVETPTTDNGNTSTGTVVNSGLSDAQYKGLLSAITALGNKQTSGGSTTNNYYTTSSSKPSGSTSSGTTSGTTNATTSASNAGKIQSATTSSSSATTETTKTTAPKTTTTSSSSSSKVTAVSASKPKAVTTTTPKVTTLNATDKEEADVEEADIAAMNRNSRIQGVEATADTGAKKGINIILAIFAGLVGIGGITAGIWYYNKKHHEYDFDDVSEEMEFDESNLDSEE